MLIHSFPFTVSNYLAKLQRDLKVTFHILCFYHHHHLSFIFINRSTTKLTTLIPNVLLFYRGNHNCVLSLLHLVAVQLTHIFAGQGALCFHFIINFNTEDDWLGSVADPGGGPRGPWPPFHPR